MRRASGRALVVALALSAMVLAGCSVPTPTPSPAVTATASVDDPQPLTASQAEELAAMPFANYRAGITAFSGHVLGGENGDLTLTGWIDFAAGTGYAQATPRDAAPILIVWDATSIAFLDVTDGTLSDAVPPLPPIAGAWQVSSFDSGVSELTRMLAALLLLSADRPDNASLLRQGGARYLGTDTVAGVDLQRYSGGGADGQPGAAPDLGTQYWLDGEGALVRFGLRLAEGTLSTVEFDRAGELPDALPVVADVG
ncbi:hypothetical protein [Microbacterium sp. ZW T5_56]|uniref:hypothetical protein n=1 Tax=Microbacterium sp. ZW T5_56 TaxID=3378081 RepID=UPI003854381B